MKSATVPNLIHSAYTHDCKHDNTQLHLDAAVQLFVSALLSGIIISGYLDLGYVQTGTSELGQRIKGKIGMRRFG